MKKWLRLIPVALSIALAIPFNCRAAQSQYDSGDPTAAEQYVLELINRARANPTAEGTRLGIDINANLSSGETATPKPPLAMNKILLGTSRAHSTDMYTRKFFAHTNPDGKDPFQRMTAAGYAFNSAGENIATSSSATAAALEDTLMIDKGLIPAGHRANLLDTGNSVFREIGVGYFSGPTPITGSTSGANGFKDFITQDFGTTSTGPFVLGVVYSDTNNNNFYDIGEGLAGVTITPDSGNFSAVTGSAGAYAFPVGTSGVLTLTASGGALASPMTIKVTLTGVNAKVDFKATSGGGGGVTAPVITSALAATGTQNADFSYSITASGTQPITFSASGLPSGLTLSGSTISGQSTQSGQFIVTLTATNSAGPDMKTLVLTIAPQVVISQSLLDTDGDGFPDELETFLGTSPTNKNDTPFGGARPVPQALNLTTQLIKLNFAAASSDSIALAGTLPIPAGFSVAGKMITVDVGGVMNSFTLDAKGFSNTPGVGMFKIRIKSVKGVVNVQTAQFVLRLSKGAFAASLTDEGLINATVTSTNSVPVILIFNQQYFTVSALRNYIAKANKSGVLK